LEEEIIKARKYRAGNNNSLSGADKAIAFDILDLRRAEVIFNRPPKTRAHTLIAANVDRAPIVGSRRALVLLVDFSDGTASQNQNHYQDMLFSLGSHATGSMRDFYREASYNQLDVDGEVSGTGGSTAGWYRAPQTKDYYTNNDYGFGSYPRNAQKLVEDVVDLAAPHVNFANYDNDGDGVVEALIIIAAGTGGEVTSDTGDIWSHKWAISPKVVDGVTIQTYFMAPEDGKVGVMSHELGHLLMKWPDLYDTDYSSRGTGRWDLMAGGSWNNSGNTPAHPSAWCKVKAGWISPTEVYNNQQNVSIRPYASFPEVYKLPVGAADSKEYFLVSNRQKLNFDAHLPGEGCIIEHIDDTQSNNTDESHYLVDIEQADGQSHLNSNANSGDAGDPFPNGENNAFTDSTTPNSKSYAGANSEVSVTNIARSGDLITADLLSGTSIGGGETTPTLHTNKTILQVYTSYHSANVWANVQDLGWLKVETGNADGVSNCLTVLCEAKANSRPVNVYADESKIFRVYLL